jgi:hypothetical protein
MLLKRFASDSNGTKIWALDVERDVIFETGVEQAPVVKDFYSWIDETDEGLERDAWFEKWLGDAPEGETGPLLDKLESLTELSKLELTRIAQFMLLQTIRTPLGQALLRHDVQAQFRRIHETLRRGEFDTAAAEVAALFERLKHRPPEHEDMLEWMEILAAEATGRKAPSEPTRNALISHIIRTLFPYGQEPLVSMASHCNLASYYREQADLVISDTPATFAEVGRDDVISDWPDKPPQSLSLPISPEWMIELRPKELGVPSEWEPHMLALNERTWRWADRFVFASRSDILETIAAEARQSRDSPLPDYLDDYRRRR